MPEDPSPSELMRLDAQVCFALHATSRAFDAVYRAELRDLGLTYPQYLAMLALWETDGPTVKRLGERLRLDSGTLSPLLKRLEAAGLVERRRGRRDERSVTVHLTEAGSALRDRAAEVPRRIGAITGLDVEDLHALRAILRRITDRLDAY
ncbi:MULTISPECIES: MarR family winged helix-turn-helix transcriptional regulator [Actinomadura]|uniref:MarR family winged helix-turn-helix transcriptional regulator n=1 Tax=Actinomadura yumaensis TaxID=111807 RepID=A0ABW2CV19_9ACTN|nr:MarR family transcriptional regulator [Actinomadura sp. J1-007]MWK35099.1 MarR family transcriptional regulator [Actinomadura sp. J1-007]